MYDPDEIILMIDDCINRESKLNEWELGFIQSISEKDSRTEKQIETLHKIWDKITG